MQLPTEAEILAAAAELGYDPSDITPRDRARFAKVALELREHEARVDPSAPLFHHEQNTAAGLLIVEGWLVPHQPKTEGNRTP